MDFSAGGSSGEPARWLEIAGKLLAARDLVGCKRLAERAVEADPNLPGADELLAVADVLLASQRQLPSGRPDPVAVLQLQPGADPAAVKRAFGRLSQLVSAPRNPRPAADTALHFVQEAFADLSKNASSDAAPAAASTPASGGASAAAADANAFWTSCPYCCHVYQYQRALVGRALRCQSAGCRRAFVATEIPTVPPIVPGTDMYYCAWGFSPMGFPKAADLSTNWKPFCPMFPGNFQAPPQSASAGTANVDPMNVQTPLQPASAGTANIDPRNFQSPLKIATAGTANVDSRNFQSMPQPASAGTANIDPRNFRSPLQTATAGTANVDSRNFQSTPQPASAGTANIDVQNVENNGMPIDANATPANVQPGNKSGVRGSPAGPSRGRMKKTTARKKVGAVLKKHASSGLESGIEPSMLGSDSWNGNAGSGSAQTVGTREININEVAKPTDGTTMLNFGGDEDIGFDLDVDATDAILGNLQHLPFLREDDSTRRMF
ncbi:uncharacterized protein LOC120694512 [Panicum virgatum]|uniref:J domain-containing protein n=1 Tax=Panicum virgatum TaxID=38727 RepID=A0A8T0WI60_PANVG|nr:uncharacterized protein LOC120694512 [Panicum virgatum]KAG2646868.1 hypothetical protein PVAP13_2KG550000 [Panicum virgatum]KAG2646869.1 hypothetical protein PVAP13_2KG550000 [Panicum virgatum]